MSFFTDASALGGCFYFCGDKEEDLGVGLTVRGIRFFFFHLLLDLVVSSARRS